MIEQIKNIYRSFSDSLISKIEYNRSIENVTCVVNISSYNWETSERDEISLIFEDCVFFKFFESSKINSTVITNALLNQNEDIIVFDFFPLYYSDDKILENPNSDFVIKSKGLKIIKN
ncbi:hypothetical protein [Chryseobacterium mucoviscidosis]|uniref:hypothetical protein n=1 Tax=Chryseobacterium mucoviscidosis TaxID=1945581 RepID=UPI003017D21B